MKALRPRTDQELLPVARADALDAEAAAPQWLVRDIWGHLAVGWIAGQPKVGKSWISLQLAISVASGTPFLDHYAVEHPGPVLVYLAEDPIPRVRDRIAAICAHRKISLAALDLFVITAPSLRLDDSADRERLAATVAHLRPRLLILDPLIRLHGGDENDSRYISALLGFLRTLSREHSVAVALVHHMSKKSRRQLGQAMRGSSDLWAWSDSAAYLTRHKDHVLLTLEHRSAAAPEPIPLTLVVGPDGPHLECVAAPEQPGAPPPLSEQVRQLLCDTDSPLSRVALRRQLHVNNQRLGEALAVLERDGAVERRPNGWTAVRQKPLPLAP